VDLRERGEGRGYDAGEKWGMKKLFRVGEMVTEGTGGEGLCSSKNFYKLETLRNFETDRQGEGMGVGAINPLVKNYAAKASPSAPKKTSYRKHQKCTDLHHCLCDYVCLLTTVGTVEARSDVSDVAGNSVWFHGKSLCCHGKSVWFHGGVQGRWKTCRRINLHGLLKSLNIIRILVLLTYI